MDPASILGVSGVAIQLVGLLGKSIKTLNDLQGRWKDADLLLVNLKSQLNTLSAALFAICQWMNLSGADESYLLRMELDGSLRCCQLLATKVDLFLDDIQSKDNSRTSSLDFRRRIKLVFRGSSLDDVLHMIDRQTASMNLLLTACHCNDALQQKAFLEEPTTQEIFQNSKQDSESLYVHQDLESTRGKPASVLSSASSKLSVVFDFDRELFATKIYNVVHRASVVTALRRNNTRANHRATVHHQLHSARNPARGMPQKEGDTKILVVNGQAREDLFLKTLLAPTLALSQEVALWRRNVIQRILAHDVAKLVEEWLTDDQLEGDSRVYDELLIHLRRVVDGYTKLDAGEPKHLTPLWTIEHHQPLLAATISKAQGLLSDLVRASTPGYESTMEDWGRYATSPTLRQLQWTSGQILSIALTKVDSQLRRMPQLANVFYRGFSMLHLIDLPRLCFNGALMEFLVLLPDLVGSEWLQGKSDVLSWSELGSLEEGGHMQTQLMSYFPRYFHDNIITQATNCIHWSFSQISERVRSGQYKPEETTDLNLVHFVVRFPSETILVEYSSSEQNRLSVGVFTRD